MLAMESFTTALRATAFRAADGNVAMFRVMRTFRGLITAYTAMHRNMAIRCRRGSAFCARSSAM